VSCSTSELRWAGLSGGRRSSSGWVTRSSGVGGWVDGRGRGANGVDRCGRGADGVHGRALDRGGGRLDEVRGGVSALVVDEGGALGDGVGLGADAQSGGSADGGKTLDSGGGVVAGSRRRGTVDGVSDGRASGVVRSRGGGSRVRGGGRGAVDLGGVGVRVGRGSKAGDDSERAHVDCLGGWLVVGWVVLDTLVLSKDTEVLETSECGEYRCIRVCGEERNLEGLGVCFI
jgi:hypothetical protein